MVFRSCTPVKVKRRSHVEWMMDFSINTNSSSLFDGVDTILYHDTVNSCSKRPSNLNIVTSGHGTGLPLAKKSKVTKENNDEHQKTQISTYPNHHDRSIETKKIAILDHSSSSKPNAAAPIIPTRVDEQYWQNRTSSTTGSGCNSCLTNSCCSSSTYGSPIVHFYSRYTTARLRASTPNQRSPLCARRLRF
jgi:hypothetical protein